MDNGGRGDQNIDAGVGRSGNTEVSMEMRGRESYMSVTLRNE